VGGLQSQSERGGEENSQPQPGLEPRSSRQIMDQTLSEGKMKGLATLRKFNGVNFAACRTNHRVVT
jgi:hypothetical protein